MACCCGAGASAGDSALPAGSHRTPFKSVHPVEFLTDFLRMRSSAGRGVGAAVLPAHTLAVLGAPCDGKYALNAKQTEAVQAAVARATARAAADATAAAATFILPKYICQRKTTTKGNVNAPLVDHLKEILALYEANFGQICGKKPPKPPDG